MGTANKSLGKSIFLRRGDVNPGDRRKVRLMMLGRMIPVKKSCVKSALRHVRFCYYQP